MAVLKQLAHKILENPTRPYELAPDHCWPHDTKYSLLKENWGERGQFLGTGLHECVPLASLCGHLYSVLQWQVLSIGSPSTWISCTVEVGVEDSWESLGLQRDQTSQSERKSILNIHWKDWCWSWDSNTLATWCKEPTHWKRPWCWERP